jgi:hypothetical protein
MEARAHLIAKEPAQRLVRAIDRLSRGRSRAPQDAARLSDAYREILRAYRALAASGAAPGKGWQKPVSAALHYLGGEAGRHGGSLRDYDHRRYGPFLGISDEGGAAEAVRRAAFASPKVQALDGKAPPLAVGVALDAERLGGVGEVPVGIDEFTEIWRECAGRTLLTTNVGGRVHLWLYLPAPVVTIVGGDTDPALAKAKADLAATFKPFLQTPGGKPRWLTVFIEFEFGSRRPPEQQLAMLRALQDHVRKGGIANPSVHHLGFNVRIGWDAKGRDAALAAIDLAHDAGMERVALDGVVRKEADRVVSFPGLLNYLPADAVGQVLRRAQERGVIVHPLKQVDTDTVARSIWSTLNTARAMGLDLGKYGLFPLTLEECDKVVTKIQRWFPDWSAAPVFYVDQGLVTHERVYVDSDRAAGLELWLRAMAKHRVKVVLIDTIDKAAHWKILRSEGDPKGLLELAEIARFTALGEQLGIKILWAGSITAPQAYEFGKLGVFGIYVTTSASEAVAVKGQYRRDPALPARKQPTYGGVLRIKTVLEAGYLGERLRRAPARAGDLGKEIACAALDEKALPKLLPAAWREWWRAQS